MQEIPHEKCELIPERICSRVAKLIPKLVEEQSCQEVEQEKCSPFLVPMTQTELEKCQSESTAIADEDASGKRKRINKHLADHR